MRIFTGPASRVGTEMSAPRVASAKVIGTSSVRSLPTRPNKWWSRTVTLMKRSPGGPPNRPGEPRPFSRIFLPVVTPAGIRALMSRGPSPLLRWIVVSMPLTASSKSRARSASRSAPRWGRCWALRNPGGLPPPPRPKKPPSKSLRSSNPTLNPPGPEPPPPKLPAIGPRRRTSS